MLRRDDIFKNIENFSSANVSRASIGSVFGHYLSLPMLRLFIPLNSVDGAGVAYDMSGQGRHVTSAAGASQSYSLSLSSISIARLLVTSSYYFTRTSEAALNITGDLTLGAWVNVESLNANSMAVGKYVTTGNQRSYWLGHRTNLYDFSVSGDGTAVLQVLSTERADNHAHNWVFLAGRYKPSTSIDIFVNDIQTTNSASIPASLFSSTAPFQIGGLDMNGFASLVWMCAGYLENKVINSLYNESRFIFGV